MADARLRTSASIRTHLIRVATWGRRFRRGARLAEESRHDCARTTCRPAPTPRACSFGRTLELDGSYAVAQLRDHRGGRAEFGGDGEQQVERIGHRAVGPEEVERSRCTKLWLDI